MSGRLRGHMISIDGMLNAVLFNGSAHETISQHCAWDHGTERASWRLNATHRALELIAPGHCDESIADVERRGVDRPGGPVL